MDRTYENPYTLTEELNERKAQLKKAQDNGDEDLAIDIQLDIMELEDRVNFAWQDEEYLDDCRIEWENNPWW